jgi:hypothetical protein
LAGATAGASRAGSIPVEGGSSGRGRLEDGLSSLKI